MKKNFIIPAIFFVLMIAAAVHYFIKKAPSEIKPFKRAKNITGVKIKNFEKGENLVISKENGQWMIGAASATYFADSSKVERFINRLKKLKFETVISETKEKQFEYSVSSKNAISVLVGTHYNMSLPEIYIGKPGADSAHFYARFKGKPRIYLASGFSRYEVTRTLRFFRDKKIADISEEDIKSISISGVGTDCNLSYKIERSSGGWKFPGDKPGDFDDIMQLCRSMTASGFSDEKFERKFEIKIAGTHSVGTHSNVSLQWFIGRKIEDFYLAKRADRNEIYKISSAKAQKIIKFLEKNARK